MTKAIFMRAHYQAIKTFVEYKALIQHVSCYYVNILMNILSREIVVILAIAL